ncbi:MAG: thiamine pyrophosphate-dependent enzyme [Bacillota bacterium]
MSRRADVGVRLRELMPPAADEGFSPGHRACPGCGATIALRQALLALGPRVIVVVPASCVASIGGWDDVTAWRVPFYHTLFPCAAAAAAGIAAGLAARGRRGVTVISWAGDAGSGDIGLQALSGAAGRGDDVLHVCYDNEACMNTGGQASGLTRPGASTSTTPAGKATAKKDLPRIMLAHGVPYVATASIAYPDDFAGKLRRAASRSGFRYVQVLAPCPLAWGYEPYRTVEMARRAVEEGVWPLWEAEEGRVRPTRRGRATQGKPAGRGGPLSAPGGGRGSGVAREQGVHPGDGGR